MPKQFLGMALAAALFASPATAQMETPKCATVSDSNLPQDLAGWAGSTVAVQAAQAPATALPTIAAGQRTTVSLHPAGSVQFILPPEKSRTPDAPHAGLIAFSVPEAGTWRMSAAKGLWIDVLAGKTRVASSAFGALAPCTSIRKVVEFQLSAGDHVIQLSGNPGATVDLMVSPKP